MSRVSSSKPILAGAKVSARPTRRNGQTHRDPTGIFSGN
uniref:Uncharacterized protein n=1 Tax=Rhizophora mucronata TaxID=61149 RepID=A0A2P2LPA0_RHIMU